MLKTLSSEHFVLFSQGQATSSEYFGNVFQHQMSDHSFDPDVVIFDSFTMELQVFSHH